MTDETEVAEIHYQEEPTMQASVLIDYDQETLTSSFHPAVDGNGAILRSTSTCNSKWVPIVLSASEAAAVTGPEALKALLQEIVDDKVEVQYLGAERVQVVR